MVKVKPLGNHILIKRSKALKTKGGILLPDSAQEKPKEGEILAVGPGKTNEQGVFEPISVKVGDKVLFTAYAGTEVKGMSDEEELLLLSEEDVLGIIG